MIALHIAYVALRLLGIIPLLCLAPVAPVNVNSFQERLNQAGVACSVPSAGNAILVNIPAFELILFNDGAPVMRGWVNVAVPLHRTPHLKTYVSSVRFRPTWRPIPLMIKSGEYRDLIWPPGKKNPLGLAAVRLEPVLLVYLHNTNRRQLFAE